MKLFLQQSLLWRQVLRLPAALAMAVCLVASLPLNSTQSNAGADKSDIPLQIGIVQRFGSKPTDTITLQADRLTLRFETNGKPQTVTGQTVKLDVVTRRLPQPVIEERVVLSTHRSFESAEASANRWRSQGIPVEIVQPGRWQVWAQRATYTDPIVRRLLLKTLQDQGEKFAYLDTKTLAQQPRASFVINGYRYTRDTVEVSAAEPISVASKVGDQSSQYLYAGTLRLQPNAFGSYTLVNTVPLETYLRGVVPHEIGTWAPVAVLEAQTILARTYALRNLRRFAIDNYQLCADVQCQVYHGLSGTNSKTDQAIAATRGLVLTYQNELIDAVYSSTNGGITAPFQDVWQGAGRPYLQARIDSVGAPWNLAANSLANEVNFRRFIQQRQGFNEVGSERFRWRYTSSLSAMNQYLRQYLVAQKSPYAAFKTIQRLDIVARSPAGRVQKMVVTTDVGSFEINKDNILIAFYPPISTLFYIEPIYNAQRQLDGYAFVGGGFGHGVGLSQTGSYYLGQLGWTSDRILSFYYPGTQLQPINSGLTFWRDPNANAAQQP